MSDTVLSVQSAARALGVSRDTVRRWADRGILPAWRLPSGHRRFERAAVTRLRRRIRSAEEVRR